MKLGFILVTEIFKNKLRRYGEVNLEKVNQKIKEKIIKRNKIKKKSIGESKERIIALPDLNWGPGFKGLYPWPLDEGAKTVIH